MENIIEAKKNATWNAWIDKAEQKIHVHGEISVGDKNLRYELGKKQQGYLEDELMLEITPKLAPGQETVTVKYLEDLANTNRQYAKVTISSGPEEIASLDVKEL